MRATLVLWLWFGAVAVTGSVRDGHPAADAPPVTLASAWIAELLDRDVDAAHAAYLAASEQDPLPRARAMALARAMELDLVLGNDAAADSKLDRLRNRLPRAADVRHLDLPREALRAALEETDPARRSAELAISRERVAERYDPGRREDYRSILRPALWQFRLRGAGRDVDAEEPAAPNRATAAWRSLVLRLLSEQRFDAAERLVARLVAGGRPTVADIASVSRRADLTSHEREALRTFEVQLEAWHAAGEEAIVARALAALPY